MLSGITITCFASSYAVAFALEFARLFVRAKVRTAMMVGFTVAGLFAPEFQIVTTVTVISSSNSLRRQVDGAMNSDPNDALEVRLDLTDELAIAADINALIDRLDLILMYGEMSAPMRQVLINALLQQTDLEERVRLAVSLIAISPEYCVLK